MEYKYLNNIHYPNDLKALPLEALPQVCSEVRDFIIQQLSHNPGHLGSSLGTVELTVALHYVFDTPNDQLVWDVGHQAYAHKILTGRRERFHTNRQFKGLAPFPSPMESEYDAFIAGHASNSISAALGITIGEEIAAKAAAHALLWVQFQHPLHRRLVANAVEPEPLQVVVARHLLVEPLEFRNVSGSVLVALELRGAVPDRRREVVRLAVDEKVPLLRHAELRLLRIELRLGDRPERHERVESEPLGVEVFVRSRGGGQDGDCECERLSFHWRSLLLRFFDGGSDYQRNLLRVGGDDVEGLHALFGMRILPLPDVEAAVLPVRPALEAAVRRHVLRQRDEVPVPHFAEVAARRLDLRAVLVVDDVGERRLDASERAPADAVEEVDVLRLRVDRNALDLERERQFVRRRVDELRRLHHEAVAVAVLVVADEVHRHAVAAGDAPRSVFERELRALVHPAVASVLRHLVDEAAVHELPEVDRTALVGVDGERRLFDDAPCDLRIEQCLARLEGICGREGLEPLHVPARGIALKQLLLRARDIELHVSGNKVHHVFALLVRQKLLAVGDHHGLSVHDVDLVPDVDELAPCADVDAGREAD